MDEEDYSSDTSDEDYVPNEGEKLSEEEESGDEEDVISADINDAEPAGVAVKTRNVNRQSKTVRQKRKGTNTTRTLDQQDSKSISDATSVPITKSVSEELNKKRADDLWSDFMKDVGSLRSSQSNKNNSSGSSAQSEKTATPQSTVKITKEYDFAGETVTVVKEVASDSKDAKLAAQQQQQSKPVDVAADAKTCEPSPTSSVGVKRPVAALAPRAGLSSVLDKIGKKPKMTVLDKSKVDWDGFKKVEGIEDDLKIHNRGKDGYLERQAFLQRADQRQFEIERGLRIGSRTSALQPPARK